MTVVFVALIIGGQAWGIVSQVNIPDKEADYEGILVYVYSCGDHPIFERDGGYTRNVIKWAAQCESWQVFHNVKVIPLIFNIGIMPLVYLVAVSLTKDKLIGLISLIAFIYNPLYTDWKASGTYDNIWSFFLLLSVWLSSWKLNVIPYGLSIATKSLSVMYLPAWLATCFHFRKSKKELIILVGIIVTGVILANTALNFIGAPIGFYPNRWEDAVYRNISVLWQVIPFLALIIVLNRSFIPKMKIVGEKLAFIWIGCALLQNPLIYLFTLQDTYSYRYVPLAAFMSILLGITFVNIGNWYAEIQLRKAKNVLPL